MITADLGKHMEVMLEGIIKDLNNDSNAEEYDISPRQSTLNRIYQGFDMEVVDIIGSDESILLLFVLNGFNVLLSLYYVPH